MKNFINFIIEDIDTNKRIDKFLSDKDERLSRTKIKKLILNKNLKINGKIITDPSKKIKNEDIINLSVPIEEKSKLKPYKFNLNIIFEDNNLIVLDKPAGISMHPGAGNYDKTLVNALIYYKPNSLSKIDANLRPGIVHRIDKNTSGIIVVAKNNFCHEELSKQFRDHTIDRVYKLLTWGKLRPRNGKIENFITRSDKNRQMMQVSFNKGKKAITNYKTIKIFENEKIPTLSLVECKIETGRTHQIRVHMSNKGNNILGDQKYKKKFKKLKNIDEEVENSILSLNRQFLHASVLGFTHPISKKRLKFRSKLPKDLENLLKKLGKISI